VRKEGLIPHEKRGFDTSDYKDFSVTEIYNLMKNDQLDMLLTNSKTGKKIFVKYHLGSKYVTYK